MRLVPALVLLAAALAGCSPDLALRSVAARTAPPADVTVDLPEPYDVVDVQYASALAAIGEAPGEGDLRERTTVQVFARHRETGAEVLFVYDLLREGAEPATVVRFRRVPERRERAGAAPRLREGRNW